jgi:hypothetical protein
MNRPVPPGSRGVSGTGGSPGAQESGDFPTHHIQIIDTDADTVFWCI